MNSRFHVFPSLSLSRLPGPTFISFVLVGPGVEREREDMESLELGTLMTYCHVTADGRLNPRPLLPAWMLVLTVRLLRQYVQGFQVPGL